MQEDFDSPGKPRTLADVTARGTGNLPPRIFLYGEPGVGKTHFASMFPNPYFIQTDAGMGAIDADHRLCTDWADVSETLDLLAAGGHDRKTVVIDTADCLLELIFQKVARQYNKKTIGDFDFGKGHAIAGTLYLEFLNTLKGIQSLGMCPIILAQSCVRTAEAVETDSYDQYTPNLLESKSVKLATATIAWADIVLFANYKVFTREADDGKKRQGVGSGARVVYTEKRPAYWAKNRFGLPHEIPLTRDDTTVKTIMQGVKNAKKKQNGGASEPAPPANTGRARKAAHNHGVLPSGGDREAVSLPAVGPEAGPGAEEIHGAGASDDSV